MSSKKKGEDKITFQILTLFPGFFDSPLKTGLLRRAIENSLLNLKIVDIKSFADKGRADDSPFGGGGGMMIAYPPLKKALGSLKNKGHVICLSPQGALWSAQKARAFAKKHSALTLICGRYGGLDARFIQEFADDEISIGDYILNGGESAALVIIETVSRFLEGFLGNRESLQKESFADFPLEGPAWTRPREITGHRLPAVVFSGDHRKIRDFRFAVSLVLTWLKRPDLLKGQRELAQKIPSAIRLLNQCDEEELKALGLSKKQGGLILWNRS